METAQNYLTLTRHRALEKRGNAYDQLSYSKARNNQFLFVSPGDHTFMLLFGEGRRDEAEDTPSTERRALFCCKSPANKPNASVVRPACHIRTPNADVDGRTQKRGIDMKHRNRNANSARNRFLQNAKSPLGCKAPAAIHYT